MRFLNFVIVLALALVTMLAETQQALAHEGHSHEKSPTHGGVVKQGQHMDIELVTTGMNEFVVYFYSKSGSLLPLTDLTFKAIATASRRKFLKVESSPRADSFAVKVLAAGVHAYEVKVEAAIKEAKDVVVFQLGKTSPRKRARKHG